MRKLVLAALAMLAFGGTAKADDSDAPISYNWVSVGEFGEKPNRIQVLIDLAHIRAEEDGLYGAREYFINMRTYVIYESKDKPDYSSFDYRHFCGQTPATKIAYPFTYWRDNRQSNEQLDIAFEFPAELKETLGNLVCGDTAAVLASGKIKEIPAVFAKDGYPLTYPWKVTWLDGTRPPYTNTPSRAEQDAEFNAKMAEAKAVLGAAEAGAMSQIEKSKAEEAFWKDQAIRRKNRPKSKLNAPLEAWLRRDEEYIVQALGMPDNAYNAGNTRILFYDSRGNWAQVFTTTDEYGNVVSSSSQSYVCSLTLELQNNQLIDFKLAGNSCDYGEFAGR